MLLSRAGLCAKWPCRAQPGSQGSKHLSTGIRVVRVAQSNTLQLRPTESSKHQPAEHGHWTPALPAEPGEPDKRFSRGLKGALRMLHSTGPTVSPSFEVLKDSVNLGTISLDGEIISHSLLETCVHLYDEDVFTIVPEKAPQAAALRSYMF